MHTQTESAREHRVRVASIVPAAAGLGLYFLTLTGEGMLGAGVRWLLAYFGASIATAIVPFGVSAEALAFTAAFAPLAWSVLGLLSPGRGSMWRRRLGARRATQEEALSIGDAIETLRGGDPFLPEPARCYVLDDPLPGAAVRGRVVVLNRGLLDSESLAAVLAHELGHANTLDGRLTEALNRLALWDDPLAPARPEHGGEGRAASYEESGGGLLWSLVRWALRLAGGGCTQRLLNPLWAAHWRAREYAADAYAASLGQTEELARHLTDYELPFDPPQPRLLFNRCEHPPVALRIERLLASYEGLGSK
jgi:Zn-dependent protease with chaperone function